MKKNFEKTLVEMFGDPIDPKFGTKIGQVPGITTVGAVGARDMGMNDDLGGVCPDCGMMSIDGKCGCESIPEEHHESMDDMCHGCGMPVEQCTCASKETCPACGVSPCQCDVQDDSVCSSCEMMSPSIEAPSCGCLSTGEEALEEKTCSECGMNDSMCECGMDEGMGTRCEACGMDESVCECGMNENDMEEVTPPGYEPIVKSLKKSGDVENPWAIAWWMKGKGIKPKKK